MLSTVDTLQPVFQDKSVGAPKQVDCIRVDGATDEGPAHESIRYGWTVWHITQSKAATLVTTRSSGSSYLNRVELQNGCLSLGHANTFIPSTLGGSCLDPDTGGIDQQKLKENLHLAITAYISRVDGCPCGETTIKLLQGSDSQSYQEIQKNLDVFLKGSKKQKKVLGQEQPELYAKFRNVWSVRNQHMVVGLPSSYIFFLRCCFKPGCVHPLCQLGPQHAVHSWYPGGPSLDYLPFPFPDPSRPWGDPACAVCQGFCSGHHTNKMINVTDTSALKSLQMPPSILLKDVVSKLGDSPLSETFLVEEAKKVLLTSEETKIWIEHLLAVIQSRKRGAAKAAATRRRKKEQAQRQSMEMVESELDPSTQQECTQKPEATTEECFCSTCGDEYNLSDSLFWICCDLCLLWYCAACEKLLKEPNSERYICKTCCK